jgi:predicted dehydrogenase
VTLAPYRVALLGLAHVHVPDHLDVVEADPDLRLTAVWDGDSLHRTRFPELARDSVDAALDHADLAIVDTPTADHEAVVAVVADRGIPLFVEKPLGRDAAEARRVAALIDHAVVPFATGFFLRSLPALREVRDLLRDGRLGEVVSAYASFTHDGLPSGAFAGETAWMLDLDRAGVGAFGDLGTHLLDALRWLWPGAELAVRHAHLTVAADHAVEVAGTALLTLGGTVPCTVSTSWVSKPGGLSVRLEGTDATAVVEGGRLTVSGCERISRAGTSPDARDALRAFVAALRDGRAGDRPTTADAVAVAELVDEVYQSWTVPSRRRFTGR